MTKILLVEDDKSLREIYGVRLQAEGYEIVSAGDGEEALALAIKEQPTLILSDVMMPKISGFDMLDILRSTTETKDVKVIMMTALSSEDQRARGEALGADRYLVKSQVGIEDVVRTVHEVLGDSVAPAPAAPVFPPASVAPQAATPAPAPESPATEPAPAAPSIINTPTEPNSPLTPPTLEPTQGPTDATQAVAAAVPPVPTDTPEIVSPAPASLNPEPQIPAPEAPAMPAPDAPQLPTPETPPAPQQPVAPTPPPVAPMPQPTAPFSTPRPGSSGGSTGGDRVIQPPSPTPPSLDTQTPQTQATDIASQMNQALASDGTNQTPPQPPQPPTPPAQ